MFKLPLERAVGQSPKSPAAILRTRKDFDLITSLPIGHCRHRVKVLLVVVIVVVAAVIVAVAVAVAVTVAVALLLFRRRINDSVDSNHVSKFAIGVAASTGSGKALTRP